MRPDLTVLDCVGMMISREIIIAVSPIKLQIIGIIIITKSCIADWLLLN